MHLFHKVSSICPTCLVLRASRCVCCISLAGWSVLLLVRRRSTWQALRASRCVSAIRILVLAPPTWLCAHPGVLVLSIFLVYFLGALASASPAHLLGFAQFPLRVFYQGSSICPTCLALRASRCICSTSCDSICRTCQALPASLRAFSNGFLVSARLCRVIVFAPPVWLCALPGVFVLSVLLVCWCSVLFCRRPTCLAVRASQCVCSFKSRAPVCAIVLLTDFNFLTETHCAGV